VDRAAVYSDVIEMLGRLLITEKHESRVLEYRSKLHPVMLTHEWAE
jgi:hypothetical protein